MSVVMASGGFDPLHVGHLNLLESAATRGSVLVALNSDLWLVKKKGYSVMPWADRARILSALRVVDRVVAFDDDDGSVVDALHRYRPDIFANGGDRQAPDPREHAACRALGIEEWFGVGGAKIRSSSLLVGRARRS